MEESNTVRRNGGTRYYMYLHNWFLLANFPSAQNSYVLSVNLRLMQSGWRAVRCMHGRPITSWKRTYIHAQKTWIESEIGHLHPSIRGMNLTINRHEESDRVLYKGGKLFDNITEQSRQERKHTRVYSESISNTSLFSYLRDSVWRICWYSGNAETECFGGNEIDAIYKERVQHEEFKIVYNLS